MPDLETRRVNGRTVTAMTAWWVGKPVPGNQSLYCVHGAELGYPCDECASG